jgi:transcription termination factor Rho
VRVTEERTAPPDNLNSLVLAELQQVASALGIRGTARMRKSQLIASIREMQSSKN